VQFFGDSAINSDNIYYIYILLPLIAETIQNVSLVSVSIVLVYQLFALTLLIVA